MKDLSKLRVAIVHDWLIGGGGGLVVEELHRMFPKAPIYTSYCSDEWRQRLNGQVITGFLQYWPFSILRKYLPVLRIWWFTHLDFSGYDLVISSSGNGEAKGVRVPEGTTHICYCHSPTHFYWRHYEQYLKQPGFGVFDPLVRFSLKLLVGPLRRWDRQAAQRPDYFIANSTHIQTDIKKYYGRESVVIAPPIDVERFEKAAEITARQGFVTVSRQVPYKRLDIIVKACTKLELPLTVIGRGPDHGRLVEMAGLNVNFLTEASDELVAEHLASAEAFLFAAFEDFGIAPVEAMAAGTPVIAYQGGGALDYVLPGKTGLFFARQSVASLEKVLLDFPSHAWKVKTLQQQADRFSAEAFRKSVEKFIGGYLSSGQPSHG